MARVIVPRTCRTRSRQGEEIRDCPVETFRTAPAYVLLGEPGMGKSETFRQEAAATNGVYVRVRDFVELPVDPQWQGKSLYLDGLDEMRASLSDGRSTLGVIRARLVQLGRPSFRLSCREADWLGAIDAGDLATVSPDRDLVVLHLDPLNGAQVAEILCRNHGIPDPGSFLEEAARQGVKDLLDNPQTLSMLATAVGPGGRWPASRQATFELACRQLALEPNRGHRAVTRNLAPTMDQLIDAAAALCAVILLANREGVALDQDAVTGPWPLVDELGLDPTLPWRRALATRLFDADDDQEERRRPLHRSVAEFLAARHLAGKVAAGLPLARVLALLTAADGGIVADLRGVHAWLAVFCADDRLALIDGDPLGVLFYGDVQAFPPEHKVVLLDALRREAERFPWFSNSQWFTHPFGALATPDMGPVFAELLRTERRDRSGEMFLDCVLEALIHGERLGFDPSSLVTIVRDASHCETVRHSALIALFRQAPGNPSAALLLDDIIAARIGDPDDELLGCLLSELYPLYLSVDKLAAAFHLEKSSRLSGSYSYFWEHTLFERIPKADLPELLDRILALPNRPRPDGDGLHAQRTLGRLLAETLDAAGDDVTTARLYHWLGCGLDQYGSPSLDQNDSERVAAWIGSRPERYYALLKYGLEEEPVGEPVSLVRANAVEAHLYGASAPDGFPDWCLGQAEGAGSDDLAMYYFDSAVRFLLRELPPEAFPLDRMTRWVASHPRFEHSLVLWLRCDVEDWRGQQAIRRRQRQAEEAKRLADWREHFRSDLVEVEAGTAATGLMHGLAKIYGGQYVEARGQTPRERLMTFFGDETLVTAALQGLRSAIDRSDLPSVEAVFDLALQGREHYIRLPCLVAMELLSSDEILALDEGRVRLMVAFRLTYDVGATPEWFTRLASLRPAWVAAVLEAYVRRQFKAGREHVSGLSTLVTADSHRDVAQRCLPSLLEVFPLRSRRNTLGNLQILLAGALRMLDPAALRVIIDRRLGQSSLEAGQRVCWLAAALVVDAGAYEGQLLQIVGTSQTRALLLARCLEAFGSAARLSDAGQAALIRLIAPHATSERPEGVYWVSPELAASDLVRRLIDALGASPTPDAAARLVALLGDARLAAWRDHLRVAQEAQRINARQAAFRHALPRAVVATLNNLQPANHADLAALVVDHLEAVGRQVRQGDTNSYRRFWAGDQPLVENDCRDALLDLLRPRLANLGVELQKEGYFNEDRRADIRVSADSGRCLVPVEVKKDSHRDLWHAQHHQLARYTADPAADGHGIYLALWFGGHGMPMPPSGPRPASATELQAALVATLPPVEAALITVVVIDCSRPATTHAVSAIPLA